MKLFMQFLQRPVTSSLLGSNILNSLFSNTHSLCCSLSVGDKFYIHTIQQAKL
jgi:hypothetical protein